MFELYNKMQIIVALTRIELGKNVIFLGVTEETSNSIIELIQTKSLWTDYMENTSKFVTVNSGTTSNQTGVPTLNQDTFPFCICEKLLLQYKSSEFVYFLISIRTMDYTYIGKCKCIMTRLYHHNSGHGSTSTMPANICPFVIMGYICGFDGENKLLQKQLEKQWKESYDYYIL